MSACLHKDIEITTPATQSPPIPSPSTAIRRRRDDEIRFLPPISSNDETMSL